MGNTTMDQQSQHPSDAMEVAPESSQLPGESVQDKKPAADEMETTPPPVAEEEKKEKKKKKKKASNKCSLEGCDGRVVLLLGDCKWCPNLFCQAHRIPEAHACPGLKNCRAEAFANNAAAVGMMKCAGAKMQSI